LQKRRSESNITKGDAKDFHAIQGQQNLIRETNPRRKPKGVHVEHLWLNKQPHISQPGNKMIKSDGDDMGMA
jgi:hypothetical protein